MSGHITSRHLSTEQLKARMFKLNPLSLAKAHTEMLIPEVIVLNGLKAINSY